MMVYVRSEWNRTTLIFIAKWLNASLVRKVEIPVEKA